MTNMVGADVEALERLAAQFEQSAERLRHQAAAVSEGVRVSAWVGPVALRFQVEWDSTHSVHLKQVAEALGENARALRKNAAEQRAASASLAGNAGTAVVQGRPAEDVRSPGHVTFDDYVDLARASYENQSPPEGWQPLTDAELQELGVRPQDLHDSSTGFDATVFKDADGNYVVSYRGTTEWLGGDALSDVQGTRWWSQQADQAVDLAKKMDQAVGPDRLTFTGHSLGGRHAALASVATGREAVTFNAAGVSDLELARARAAGGHDPNFFQVAGASTWSTLSVPADSPFYAGERVEAAKSITNYTTPFDPLTRGQQFTGAPDALGEQVTTGEWNINPVEAHDLDRFERP